MRLAALLFLATTTVAAFSASPAASASPVATTDARLEGAYTFNEGGWTYVHLAGTP